MTDQAAEGPAEAAQAPQEAQQPQDPAAGPQEPPQPLDQGQARKDERHRERLRAAESELARLRGQLEAIRRSEAEQLAGRVLHDGRDLWIGGLEVSELLDPETGELDQRALGGQLERIRQERPRRIRPQRTTDAGAHVRGHGPVVQKRDWSDLLKKPAR